MADKKTIRRQRKSVVSRHVNALKRFIVEENKAEVTSRREKLMKSFNEFEMAHEVYHDTLEDQDAIEKSDKFSFEVQDTYIAALKSATDWIRSVGDPDQKVKPAGDGEISIQEMMSLMNLPKIEIKPFNGDPLKFSSFIALFNESVDKTTSDDQTERTRLIQYTTGKAAAAIETCALIGGTDGYRQAKDILVKRYGNNHLVSEKIIKDIRKGNPVKNAEELQQLADEIQNCEVTLKQMKRYHEVDTQQTIIDVANRLQPYIRTRWKKKALEIKRSKDEYPSFHDLVLFVQEFAEDANDPVYGQFNTRVALTDSRSHVKEKSIQSTNFMASTKMSVPAKKTFCTLRKAEHRLIFCPEFKCMDVQKRKKFVCDNRLCEICLHYGHFKKSCRSPYVCVLYRVVIRSIPVLFMSVQQIMM